MSIVNRYTFDRADKALSTILSDLSILAGDQVGPSDVSWQDVAGTCAINLRQLAKLLDLAREGQIEPFSTFPSPTKHGAKCCG